MWNKKKDRPNRLGEKEQLCWSCDNAINGCSWSRSFQPVNGWDAEPDGDSYKIYDCPKFYREKDHMKGKTKEEKHG